MRKYEVSINNKQYSVVVKKYTQQEAELEINGVPYAVKLDAPIVSAPSTPPPVQAIPVQAPPQPATAPQPQVQPGQTPAPAAASPASQAPVAANANDEIIIAPIPGSILDILVKEGDSVTEGQTVFKMEAMKMENDINAVGSGVVKSINVAVGDAVNQGQELMVIG